MKALTIILGVAMCILGVCAATMPFRVFLGFGWIVGALFIVYGIQMAMKGFKKETRNIWSGVFGVISTILGLWISFSAVQRALTDLMIAYLVGFNLLFYGVLRIMEAYKLYKAGEKKTATLILICGLVSAIGGILSVGHPILTMISVGFIIAFNLISQGVTMILVACMAKGE